MSTEINTSRNVSMFLCMHSLMYHIYTSFTCAQKLGQTGFEPVKSLLFTCTVTRVPHLYRLLPWWLQKAHKDVLLAVIVLTFLQVQQRCAPQCRVHLSREAFRRRCIAWFCLRQKLVVHSWELLDHLVESCHVLQQAQYLPLNLKKSWPR